MKKFKQLERQTQTVRNFFEIRCKKCLMPKTAWKWNDAEGNSCQYCNPLKKEETLFPEDMANDNASFTIEELIKSITQQQKGRHNCLVSITGGRDSSFTLYYVKEVLGLSPIAFNFNTGFVTNSAQQNMINITKELGVDFIQYSIDWTFLKKLARGFFKNFGEVCSLCHQGYFYTVQKVAKWTELNYVIRGLCKKTEANRVNSNYINWYCLSDDQFKFKVNLFAESENISKKEILDNQDFMNLREWTDPQVKKIDIPDMINYKYNEVDSILGKLKWKKQNFYIHSDCIFAPILVCCQRLSDGYSKKHVNISNLAIDGVDKEILKRILLKEENIDFFSIKEIEIFLELLDIDKNCFEDIILKTWGAKL